MGKNLVLACLVLLAGLVLAGCVQSPPYATPTPTASPTVTATPTATPGPGFPEKEKNPLNLTQIETNSGCEKCDYVSIRMISPTSFELVATVYASTPCANTTAYWNSGYDSIRVYFEHTQPNGVYCAEVLELRTFKAVVDYSSVVALRPFKKVEVYNFNELVSEETFEGMFCGGIAAFQCPYAFDCKLDGGYPDAGGKCVFNASVYSGPRPA